MTKNIATDTGLLQAALVGYQHQKEQIEAKIAEIQRQIGGRAKAQAGTASPTSSEETPRKRKPLSAAARKRIAAAQKKRWAEFHKSKEV
jgi:hypothetical protein